jgi:hypothetical protein
MTEAPRCSVTNYERDRCLCGACQGARLAIPRVAVPAESENARVPARAREEARLWRDDNDVWRDQFNRDATECQAAIELAQHHADAMRSALEAVNAGGGIVLGKLGGSRQFGRLHATAQLFEHCAERDQRFLRAFEKKGARP